MSRREPMAPISGLRKTELPPPAPRPQTLRSVPVRPDEETSDQQTGPAHPSQSSAAAPEQAIINTSARSRDTKRSHRKQAPAAPKTRVPVSATAQTTSAISVSISMPLAEDWRERARRDRISQVDVLLDALVAQQDNLSDLVKTLQTSPAPVHDGLFDRTPKPKGERSVTVSLRLKSNNLEVIDDLKTQHHADSRSQLIAAALTTYLQQ